ncbi:MAG: TlpA family protein disulfide reductase [Chloroflexi bacterium]|nr:TlpA family protein disulfide reductase [Chloroflexota bacterium]
MKTNPNKQVFIGVAVILGICLVCCVVVGGVATVAAPYLADAVALVAGIPLEVGSDAPDFELESLEGGEVRLSQFRGQPVLLVFGATWCPPCRAEAPLIQDAREDNPRLIVLLVDVKEEAGLVQSYVDEMNLTHLVLLDLNGLTSQKYHVNAIPASFFIDEAGVIRALEVGQLTRAALAEKLAAIGIEP